MGKRLPQKSLELARARRAMDRLNSRFTKESGFDIPDITNVKSFEDVVARAQKEVTWFSDWARQTVDAMLGMIAEEVVNEQSQRDGKRGIKIDDIPRNKNAHRRHGLRGNAAEVQVRTQRQPVVHRRSR